ncbi:hypothetical protein CDD81_44 [Ophiocordyceps australis]|uniref:Fumarylacetoacetase n=1 Tax=Ophiocordyceps australis TaxID=1399860 RepID=A0A2C5YIH6_9HYPO|nr:hypothetical protein CDD81_44 [Ophiocordyceps australis]
MSWLSISPRSHFSLANLPFGIISTQANVSRRPGVAIGDYVLDLSVFASQGGFAGAPEQVRSQLAVFEETTLNSFAALGRPVHRLVRDYLQEVLRASSRYADVLEKNVGLREAALLQRCEVKNHVPLQIGDYTDFFAGKNHAYSTGVLFRGPQNALQPNYMHLPVGYHGRASSVVVSGTPIHRPWGQILRDPMASPKVPVLVPAEKLDLELEMAAFVCRGNELGCPVAVDRAEELIFGYVLMNDWSARDVQLWEYVPLGPFTAKNFGTSISPWVVLADALHDLRAPGIANETPLLPYLQEKGRGLLDIELEVELITAKGNRHIICKTNSTNLLWSWPQMIAHHTITGCNMQTGDLLGSGTISGTEPTARGCLLEQTQGGKTAIKLEDGEERIFLKDGDSIVIRGCAGKEGALVGFGEVSGMVMPALDLF